MRVIVLPHTVTAACVGLPGVQIYLTQEVQGGAEGTTIELVEDTERQNRS